MAYSLFDLLDNWLDWNLLRLSNNFFSLLFCNFNVNNWLDLRGRDNMLFNSYLDFGSSLWTLFLCLGFQHILSDMRTLFPSIKFLLMSFGVLEIKGAESLITTESAGTDFVFKSLTTSSVSGNIALLDNTMRFTVNGLCI